MENNPRGNSEEPEVVDLKGLPTEYIKKMILTKPSDPRFPEALREMSAREVRVSVPEIPDHVIAELFIDDLGPDDRYEKIPWLRDTSLQALSFLNPEKAKDTGEAYEVLMCGVCWRFAKQEFKRGKKTDEKWILISVGKPEAKI